MSRDVRELIMDRIADLVRVQGVATSARNLPALSDSAALPAVIVFDGNEESDLTRFAGKNGLTVYPVRMEPIIRVIAQGDEAVVGNDLCTLRLRIISAILSDATLAGLSADGTGVRYLGTLTNFTQARAVQGDMVIRFSILYYLRPSEL